MTILGLFEISQPSLRSGMNEDVRGSTAMRTNDINPIQALILARDKSRGGMVVLFSMPAKIAGTITDPPISIGRGNMTVSFVP